MPMTKLFRVAVVSVLMGLVAYVPSRLVAATTMATCSASCGGESCTASGDVCNCNCLGGTPHCSCNQQDE